MIKTQILLLKIIFLYFLIFIIIHEYLTIKKNHPFFLIPLIKVFKEYFLLDKSYGNKIILSLFQLNFQSFHSDKEFTFFTLSTISIVFYLKMVFFIMFNKFDNLCIFIQKLVLF